MASHRKSSTSARRSPASSSLGGFCGSLGGILSGQPLPPVREAWGEEQGESFDSIVTTGGSTASTIDQGPPAATSSRRRAAPDRGDHAVHGRRAWRLLRLARWPRGRDTRARPESLVDDEDSDEERMDTVFEEARMIDDNHDVTDDWLFGSVGKKGEEASPEGRRTGEQTTNDGGNGRNQLQDDPRERRLQGGRR